MKSFALFLAMAAVTIGWFAWYVSDMPICAGFMGPC